jgi:hypothetical protein
MVSRILLWGAARVIGGLQRPVAGISKAIGAGWQLFMRVRAKSLRNALQKNQADPNTAPQ